MKGLSNIDNGSKELAKVAAPSGEGSLENNLKQLITDEAYSQISSKFPKLVPLIVGVNIVEMINENTAIGAAVIGLPEKKMLIPVVYTNGIIDASTFIYSEEDDVLLALTKKVVAMIVSSSPILSGTVPGEKDKKGFDIGDIHKLFVPPKTFSPKIASGGILFAVLEQSDILKTAMAQKLEDAEYKEIFERIYGEEAVKFVESSDMEKTASEVDDTPVEVAFTREDIMSGEWLNKEAAMQEFAVNGYAISHGANTQTKSLRKIASVETKLKEIIGTDAIQSIDTHHSGIYTVYNLGDLKPVEVLVSREIGSSLQSTPSVKSASRIIGSMEKNDGNAVVGTQINLSDSKMLKPFSKDSLSGYRKTLVFFKDGAVFGSKKLGSESNVESGLGTTTISIDFSPTVKNIVIEKGSNSSPLVLGATLYVGENNVRVLDENANRDSGRVSPIRMRDLDADDAKGDIVKVAFDGVEFIHDHKAYSRGGIVNKLLDSGFEKSSVYGIVKTAAENGSAELVAVNAKLDMLMNVVMNLAGQVQQSVQATTPIEEAPVEASPGTEAPAPVDAAATAEPQPSLAMQDPNSGIQTPEAQAAAEQQMMDQEAADRQLLGQAGPQEEQDVAGMNQGIDPMILQTLSELKDSKIMDVGVISMLAGSSDVKDVVSHYRNDILSGASALGRILLNAMVKKDELIVDVGEPKYKQLTNSMKTVFTRISDLYVDIARLELESDGKVAN